MKEIIITAILSAILTVTGSYFIMKSQLTAEQNYWLERQAHERLSKALDSKVKLLESFNNEFLKLDALTSKMKLVSSNLQAEFHVCYEAIKLNAKDFNCKANSNDYLNVSYKYREQTYKLSVTLQMLPIYYGENVSSLITPLNKIIQQNFDNINNTLEKVDKNNLDREVSVYFERDMNSTPEFQKARGILIQAMLDDISNSKSNLFKS